MEASVFSEINQDGLRFLKYDIMIGRGGLTNISGDTYANMPPVSKNELQPLGNILGRGNACQVSDGLYKPLGVKVAIKVKRINTEVDQCVRSVEAAPNYEGYPHIAG